MACAVHSDCAVPERTGNAAATSSSIHDMTVAEVRRSLSFIRKAWEEQHTDCSKRPMYLSDPITCGTGQTERAQSVEMFALRFVLAHHTRRLTKSPSESSSLGQSMDAAIQSQADPRVPS